MSRQPSARNVDTADRLHSAALHLLRSLRKVDDQSGLSAPRLSILSVVVFAGPRTLGELAVSEQVKPPTITRLVAALERDGMVKREVDKSDRRVTRIHATRKGEKVMIAGRNRRVRELALRIAKLPDKDARDLDEAARLIASLATASS